MTKAPYYSHDLGKGLTLNAYSLDPNLDKGKLAEMVSSLDGKSNQDLSNLAKTIINTDYVEFFRDLELDIQNGKYEVPMPLKAYREAIGKKWDSEGRFNGPVLIATAEIKVPLKVVQGGYYDFAATRLTEQPAKLLPEIYQEGKTVKDILNENGIDVEKRARYFGLAHLMWPEQGENFLLVQRAKGMGIAGDCMSTPGSTPDLVLNNPGLQKKGFSVEDYWSYHFAEEMKDEFHLRWGDFWVEDIHLFDDKQSIPHGAVNITTNLSAKEIAERAYGDPRVLKEHNVIYEMKPEAIPVILQKFPIFPSVARAMDFISICS